MRRAVAICDPNGDDELLADFLRTHEDRDEPIAGFEQRDRIFFEAAERLRGTMLDPGLEMAAAVATYLAYRRDELTDSDADILRLAARAEFGAHPTRRRRRLAARRRRHAVAPAGSAEPSARRSTSRSAAGPRR